VALSRPRTSAEYQDILASNLEEYERIARTLGDMLFLAKAEENTLAHAGEVVDLASEVDALIDFYEALAEERQVRIVRQGQFVIAGGVRQVEIRFAEVAAGEQGRPQPGIFFHRKTMPARARRRHRYRTAARPMPS